MTPTAELELVADDPTTTSGGPRRLNLIMGSVAAVAVLAAAFLTGLFWPALTAPGDESAEAGFARDMSVHHAQAVSMAIIEYDRTSNVALKRIAFDIVVTQQGQIGTFNGWLDDWGLSARSDGPPMDWVPGSQNMLQADGRMPGMASEAEIERLRTLSGREVDILFCELMIRHHLGGIHMIDAVLDRSGNDKVVALATTMRNVQQAEVGTLEMFLRDLRG